jgi:hypothetical protein
MVVVECSLNPKCAASRLVHHTSDSSQALDPNFLTTLVWRWNQKLNANLRSDWRAFAAENQGAVESNIAGEAALRVLCAVIPMEDYRQLQLVADRIPTLRGACWDQAQTHRWNERMAFSQAEQEGGCLKIVWAKRAISGPDLSSKARFAPAVRLYPRESLLSDSEESSRSAMEKKVCISRNGPSDSPNWHRLSTVSPSSTNS